MLYLYADWRTLVRVGVIAKRLTITVSQAGYTSEY